MAARRDQFHLDSSSKANPKLDGGTPAAIGRGVKKRGPPTPLQYLDNFTILECQGRRASFYIFQPAVTNVFQVSNLAEPSTSKEMLSCHVRDSIFVRKNGNLLVTDFKRSAFAGFVT